MSVELDLLRTDFLWHRKYLFQIRQELFLCQGHEMYQQSRQQILRIHRLRKWVCVCSYVKYLFQVKMMYCIFL